MMLYDIAGKFLECKCKQYTIISSKYKYIAGKLFDTFHSFNHSRYVDEVVRDAPWVLDDAFLEKHKIDFVAHDDVPYTIGSGTDIYAGLKAVSSNYISKGL